VRVCAFHTVGYVFVLRGHVKKYNFLFSHIYQSLLILRFAAAAAVPPAATAASALRS
jgi:hypothetical protein